MVLLRLMLWFIGIALVVAVAIATAVYLKQDELIFYPQALDATSVQALESNLQRIERIELRAEDGFHLRGWLLPASHAQRAPLILYFGGNAEEVSWVLPDLARLTGWAALAVNYRGYGASEGVPSERALFRDALALYDHLASRDDIDAARIVAIGRSLGTGVAVHLAAERALCGVVLVSPYDSLTAIAQRAYPYLPARWLLRHRFDSIARAPRIRVPMLAIAAAQDTLIPSARSRKLVEAWGGPARLEVLEGRDHNNVHGHPLYWSVIGQFLRECAGPSTSSP